MKIGRCCKPLHQRVRQVTNKEVGWRGDAPETAVSTSPGSSLGTAGQKLSDLISSKDGRNADFLMYEYQKLHV